MTFIEFCGIVFSVSHPLLEAKPITVAPYNHPEYKPAIDDAIIRFLVEEARFVEDQTHANFKMIVGYIACSFAVYASYLSYYLVLPFQEIKTTMGLCSLAYFVFNGLYMGYAYFIEKNVVFKGKKREGKSIRKVEVSTTMDKYTDIIEINVDGYNVKQSVGRWFDADGDFCAPIFAKDFTLYLEKKKK